MSVWFVCNCAKTMSDSILCTYFSCQIQWCLDNGVAFIPCWMKLHFYLWRPNRQSKVDTRMEWPSNTLPNGYLPTKRLGWIHSYVCTYVLKYRFWLNCLNEGQSWYINWTYLKTLERLSEVQIFWDQRSILLDMLKVDSSNILVCPCLFLAQCFFPHTYSM